ncbi:MAG TPA: hypothetical protein VN960_05585 [Gaiellaceae bacterium]|nr:hypothetical protein [Gaiellaceae bacterium]
MTRAFTTLALTTSLVLAGCGAEDTAAPTEPQAPPPVTTAEETTTAAATTTTAEATTTEKKKKRQKKRSGAGGWSEAIVPGYTTSKADVYRLARELCGVFTPAQVAKEYNTSRDPFSAAEGYAKGYQDPFEQPALEGCLAGFK